jgi:NADH-quinone oxidoreductase subunit F
VVHVCDDVACAGRASSDLAGDVTMIPSPCLGACDQPAAMLDDRAGSPLASLTQTPAAPQPASDTVLLKRVGVVDPGDFDGYLASGGGTALRRARTQGAQAVLDDLEASGLVGRGGAAFPVVAKWRAVAEAPGARKHVIANGDESEPGTFKDRLLMEADPHAVVEGLLVAAATTGADRAWIYLRAEYPDAADRLRAAAASFQDAGLADGIAIEFRVGAGAYICGEETALFASIEGHRGEPRQKPPYPVTSGLFGEPTAINNIETLAAVVAVLTDGPEAFRSRGTDRSSTSSPSPEAHRMVSMRSCSAGRRVGSSPEMHSICR